MLRVDVAVSKVNDGTMYRPSVQADEDVINNRKAWLTKNDIQIGDTTRLHISYDQPDYCRYRIVDASNKGEGMLNGKGDLSDAIVTTDLNHALFLPVADCIAATLFDKVNGVLMLSHLGRHSLEQQGGLNSVQFLIDNFGTKAEDVQVWLSPAVGKDVYPIFKLDGKGMKEAALEQLSLAGILPENINDNKSDTAVDDEYFSHSEFMKGNKDVEGRFAMVAVMRG